MPVDVFIVDNIFCRNKLSKLFKIIHSPKNNHLLYYYLQILHSFCKIIKMGKMIHWKSIRGVITLRRSVDVLNKFYINVTTLR